MIVAYFVIVPSRDRPSSASVAQDFVHVANAPAMAYASAQMADIEAKVAMDSVAQYEITKRGGDRVDMCVHAGMVAAAFLQAKNEAQYRVWKATEKSDCDK